MKRISFSIFFLLIAVSFAFAQPGKGRISVAKNLAMANKLIAKGSFYNAVDYLENAFEQEPSNPAINYLLADSYRQARDYANAETYFGRVLSMDDPATALNYPLVQFYYAQMLKRNEKYPQARDQFEQFIDKYSGDRADFYKNWSRAEITGSAMALENEEMEKTKAFLLGKNINSGYTDYAPLPLNDSFLIFSSIRSKYYMYSESKYKYSDIYVSSKTNGNWDKPYLLKGPQRLVNNHTGHGSYSPNMDRFYFTRCPAEEPSQVKCAIFYTQYINESWSVPLQIKEINMSGYKSTSPCVVEDGYNRERIYFSSNMPGGRGGMDIWYVVRDSDGNFSAPIHLGNKINTSNNDITPFFEKKTETLYFSSNGYPGFGGFDIFKSSWKNGAWEPVEHLESPVNSSVDDMYFIPSKNAETGFFVSNRSSPYGVNSKTCCDKIYFVDFDYEEPIIPVEKPRIAEGAGLGVEGQVFAATEETIENLSGAKIQLFERFEGEEKLLLAEIYSSEKPYYLPLEIEKNYTLRFSHPSYNSEELEISTVGYEETETIRKDLYLVQNTVQEMKISGKVFSDDGKNLSLLEDVTLTLFKFDPATGEREQVSKKVIDNGIYDLAIDESGSYVLVFSSPNHFTTGISVSTLAPDGDPTMGKDVKLKVKKTGAVFRLENIYYDKNSYELRDESIASLSNLVDLLNNNPTVIIEIGSHTDDTGEENYNQYLSRKRAKNVVKYLMEKGIDPLRLKYKGYGESTPVAPNDTPENMQLNRRTEFMVVGNLEE